MPAVVLGLVQATIRGPLNQLVVGGCPSSVVKNKPAIEADPNHRRSFASGQAEDCNRQRRKKADFATGRRRRP